MAPSRIRNNKSLGEIVVVAMGLPLFALLVIVLMFAFKMIAVSLF